MRLRPLPPAPHDDQQAAEWVIVAAGAYAEAVTEYYTYTGCIEEHRKAGAIR